MTAPDKWLDSAALDEIGARRDEIVTMQAPLSRPGYVAIDADERDALVAQARAALVLRDELEKERRWAARMSNAELVRALTVNGLADEVDTLKAKLAECRDAWLREEEAHRANVRGMDETISDLRAKLAQAEQELAEANKLRSACNCLCGHSIAYNQPITTEELRRVRALMVEHDAKCPSNPLFAPLAASQARERELREKVVDALDVLNMHALPESSDIGAYALVSRVERNQLVMRLCAALARPAADAALHEMLTTAVEAGERNLDTEEQRIEEPATIVSRILGGGK